MIERLKPGAAVGGDIVDLNGKVLGQHDGIIHFTVGQRKGLKIATGAPLYVMRLDAASRRVVVGPREALRTRRITLRDINWIGARTIEETLAADGLRFSLRCAHARPQPAWFDHTRGFEVELYEGEDGVSPGQACVLRCGRKAKPACSAAASSSAALLLLLLRVRMLDDAAKVVARG
jgi:tRNA-specific 2-thiouridylase